MDDLISNASNFIYNTIFYNKEFESIMSKIIVCYNLMKSNGYSLQNNENLIRNEIVNNYLMNNDVRRDIGINYLFYRELPTTDDSGRVDIYVATLNTFKDTDAYYIIECKRLDGNDKLNREYIINGINRFINERKYSFYDNTAGMIGFIVEKIDICQNVIAINTLLSKHFTNINTEQKLRYKKIVSDFKYSYSSKHKIDDVSKIIYHLMLDFSDNIIL